MANPSRRLGATTLAVASLLIGIYTVMVLQFGRELRAEIHEKMIERTAALLHPVALQLISDSEASGTPLADVHAHLVSVLRSARQEGMMAMAIFDSDGAPLEKVPSTQLFVELPFDDYVRLAGGTPISRFHASRESHPKCRLLPSWKYCCRWRVEDRTDCLGLRGTTWMVAASATNWERSTRVRIGRFSAHL